MANAVAQTTQTPTVASILSLPPQQRAAALSQLPPDQQADAAAAVAAARRQDNLTFVRRSRQLPAVCPPTSGGIQATYTTGTQLVYDLPSVGGGFAKELLITINVQATLAAGTAAVYGLTAAGLYALFDSLELTYGTVQARMRFYEAKLINMVRRYLGMQPGSVVAGQSITAVQNLLGPTPTITAGAQTWTLVVRIPLTALHDLSPAGLLPIMSGSTKGQIKLNTAQNILGVDAMQNVLYAVSGSGHAISAVGGTVKMEVIYADGVNFRSNTPLVCDLAGEPTCQMFIDNQLNPLTAGTPLKQKISNLLMHGYVFHIVMDGQQSNKFCAATNVQEFSLLMDSVGQNRFFQYGNGSNQAMADYYQKIRNAFGQDLDEGVFVSVAGPAFGQQDASNGEGDHFLNMMPNGGWTDVNHEWTIGAVGNGSFGTPRIETYVVSLNPAGLVLA